MGRIGIKGRTKAGRYAKHIHQTGKAQSHDHHTSAVQILKAATAQEQIKSRAKKQQIQTGYPHIEPEIRQLIHISCVDETLNCPEPAGIAAVNHLGKLVDALSPRRLVNM